MIHVTCDSYKDSYECPLDILMNVFMNISSIRSYCYDTGMGADEMLQGFGVAIKMVITQ